MRYATFGHCGTPARSPHLRSPGKGANKTPLDRAAWPLACRVESGRFARRRQAASPCRAPEQRRRPARGRIAQPAQAGCGRTDGTRKETASVTTMSSAEPTRRDFLYIATASVAAVGGIAAIVPLIAQMNPDASTIAAGAPIEVDLSPIADGQVIKVFWRGKPIYVNHRTKKQIEEAENVDVAKLPDPQPDSARVKPGHDQWQVLIGICTHLGCIPIAHQGDYK